MNPFNICPLDKFELIGLSPLLLTQLILLRIFSTCFEKCHRRMKKRWPSLRGQCFTNRTQILGVQLWISSNLSEHVLSDTNGTTVSKSLLLLLRLSLTKIVREIQRYFPLADPTNYDWRHWQREKRFDLGHPFENNFSIVALNMANV